MAFVVADRVKETSTTNGTGTLNLSGASTGYQSFVAGIGNGNTTVYAITDGTDWEVGIGTVTDATPDTLSRTTILDSSNAGSAVNWTGGATKDVSCVFGADGYLSGLNLLNTDAGAGIGPTLRLRRQSASPADNDLIGAIDFEGRDSAANDTVFGRIYGLLSDVTNATEDGALIFSVMKAGVLTTVDVLTANSTDQGRLGSMRVYAASGTWTKPDGLKFAVVHVLGGGGGGGSGNTVDDAAGGGGGAGGYSREKILAADLGSTENYVVGAGGTSTTTTDGTNGGTSNFGTLPFLQATGGTGGSEGTTAGGAVNGGGGGAGTNGDLNTTGGGGGPGSGPGLFGGHGGDSIFGGGGRASTTTGDNGARGGGGGGARRSSATNRAGGSGGDGLVLVEEYF